MIDLLFYYKLSSILIKHLQKSSLIINSENLQLDHPPHISKEKWERKSEQIIKRINRSSLIDFLQTWPKCSHNTFRISVSIRFRIREGTISIEQVNEKKKKKEEKTIPPRFPIPFYTGAPWDRLLFFSRGAEIFIRSNAEPPQEANPFYETSQHPREQREETERERYAGGREGEWREREWKEGERMKLEVSGEGSTKERNSEDRDTKKSLYSPRNIRDLQRGLTEDTRA